MIKWLENKHTYEKILKKALLSNNSIITIKGKICTIKLGKNYIRLIQ